ncbi:MAG TPA: ABC transporter substrate-binding protein [Tepidisphaeraceae bacterium]|nr:ABC transporter substrate-binding protein [Tepidisphaeraceae bacterium]
MRTFLVLAVICLVIGFGCDRSAPSNASAGNAAITLQLNWLAEPQFGGFYAAAIDGEYARQGLDVTVQQGGASAPTIDMLAAGTVKFAIVSGDEILVARARGKKVVAIYAVYQTHPQGILTHAARGFQVIDDVFKTEGTLAMEQGLPYSNFLKAKFGLDKLKIVPSPAGDLSVFRSDPQYSTQCFVTSEPLAARKLGLDVKTFLIADAGYNPYATVLATTEDAWNNERATVVAMVKAVHAGWTKYIADPTAANRHMQTLNSTLDAETFAASAAAQLPLIDSGPAVGNMTRARWQTLADQLVELKVLNSHPPIDECFIDPAELLR